jgi:uncharacterized membrane protein YpjA
MHSSRPTNPNPTATMYMRIATKRIRKTNQNREHDILKATAFVCALALATKIWECHEMLCGAIHIF